MLISVTLSTLAAIGLSFADSLSVPQPPESGWSVQDYIFEKPASSAYGSPTTISGVSVFTADTTKAGLFLACTPGGTVARISVIPADFSALESFKTKRAREKRITLFFNDEKIDQSAWTYFPEYKVYAPRTGRLSAKLFNAVVRGDTIKVQIQGKGEHLIPTPSVDENFSEYNSRCRALRS